MHAEARTDVESQIATLNEQGYVVVRRLVADATLKRLDQVAHVQLAASAVPLELEADLQYPGSPTSRGATGGGTVRRLLDAYGRDPDFAAFGKSAAIRYWMESYFGEGTRMSRAHHNCVMTKHPLYGSLTGWHRDVRYWSFEREDLVSVWLALGEENVSNGALWFVPASHRMTFEADRYDEAQFFRSDRADNVDVIRAAESPNLEPGDAVFFHGKTLHSAGKNHSAQVKFSLVYTYHADSNAPQPGTRSNAVREVQLA